MTSRYTIQNALAYVLITGDKFGLPVRTRVAITLLTTLTIPEDVTNGTWYELTEEGTELAHRSRLWKAHEYLVGRGLEPVLARGNYGPRPGMIYYRNVSTGERGFATSDGRAYFGHSDRRACSHAATFKNG